MYEDGRVSFDLDKPLEILRDIVEGVLAIFRPVIAAITKIAGEGSAGFIVVFVIFFTIYLIRMSARSGHTDVFAHGMRYVGKMGVSATLAYLGLLALSVLVLPTLVALFMLLSNSVMGAEPTLMQFSDLMMQDSPARAGFLADFVAFHFAERDILPLGFQASFIILAAFGSMWLVGQAIAKGPETIRQAQ